MVKNIFFCGNFFLWENEKVFLTWHHQRWVGKKKKKNPRGSLSYQARSSSKSRVKQHRLRETKTRARKDEKINSNFTFLNFTLYFNSTLLNYLKTVEFCKTILSFKYIVTVLKGNARGSKMAWSNILWERERGPQSFSPL